MQKKLFIKTHTIMVLWRPLLTAITSSTRNKTKAAFSVASHKKPDSGSGLIYSILYV